jgi:hypothetical protein
MVAKNALVLFYTGRHFSNFKRCFFLAAAAAAIELLIDDRKFHCCYRMSKEGCSEVAENVRPYIHKQDTNFRRASELKRGY